MAAIVPMEVPMAVETKPAMTKRPGTINCTGIKLRPKFTVESTPPDALDTTAKAPAKR